MYPKKKEGNHTGGENTFAPHNGQRREIVHQITQSHLPALRQGLNPEGAELLDEVTRREPPRRAQQQLEESMLPRCQLNLWGRGKLDRLSLRGDMWQNHLCVQSMSHRFLAVGAGMYIWQHGFG